MSSHYTDYVAACHLCGDVQPRRDLIRVLFQRGPYGSAKTAARLCSGCASKLTDWLGAEMPDLDAVRKQALPSLCHKCYRFSAASNHYCPHCGEKMEAADGDH